LAEFFRSDPACVRVRISNATTDAFAALLTSFYNAPGFVGLLSTLPIKHVLSCWEISLRFEIQSVAGQCVAVMQRTMTAETAPMVISACEKRLALSPLARELKAHAQSILDDVNSQRAMSSPGLVPPPPTSRVPMYKVMHSDLVATPTPSVTASVSAEPQRLGSSSTQPLQPLSYQPSRDLVEICANVGGTGGSQVRQRYLQYLSHYNRQRQYLEQQVGVVRDLELTAEDSNDGLRVLRLTHTRLVHDIRALENEMFYFRAECEDTAADAKGRKESQEAEEMSVRDQIAQERGKILQTALARSKETLLKELEKDLEDQKGRYQAEMRSWAREKAQLLEDHAKGIQEGKDATALQGELDRLLEEEASLKAAVSQTKHELEENQKYDTYTRQYVRAAGVTKQELTMLLDEGKDVRVALASYQQMRKRLGTEVANAEGRVAWLKGKMEAEVQEVLKLRQCMTTTQAAAAH